MCAPAPLNAFSLLHLQLNDHLSAKTNAKAMVVAGRTGDLDFDHFCPFVFVAGGRCHRPSAMRVRIFTV